MCCLLEIGMTIWGIVTLCTGKFHVSKEKVVRGGPAYLVGALLTATFPLALGLGMVVGAVMLANGANQADFQELGPLVLIDVIIVAVVLGVSFAIAIPNAKHPSQFMDKPMQPTEQTQLYGQPNDFRPVDPNPYQSPSPHSQNPYNPYSDPQDRK